MSGGHNKRGLLRRFLGALEHLDREERGFPPIGITPPGNVPVSESGHHIYHNGRPRPTRVVSTDRNLLISPNDKLLGFRALTGIDSAPALMTQGHHDRTAPNVGIYTRVVQAEETTAQRYKFFSILINTCLGIQIVVAAAVTALGAASGPHSAVTAFGAINTIMAGILTYLKGSGLPDRLKHYHNEWKNIREYIEQREREFCLVGCELDVQQEIFVIETMYEEIKHQVEATKSGAENHTSGPESSRRSFYPSRQPAVCASCSNKKAEPESPVSVPEPSLEKN